MKHFVSEFKVSTAQNIEFIDITERVQNLIQASGINRGLVNIITRHTTTGVKINERCLRLQKDMQNLLSEIAPAGKPYQHNEQTVDGRPNAHSHLMSLLLGSTECIPVINGQLNLGQWQSIFFIELDGPRPSREVTVTVIGE